MADEWVEDPTNPLEDELRKAEENTEIEDGDDFLTVVEELDEQAEAAEAAAEDDDEVLVDADDEDENFRRKRKGKRSAKERIGELTREKRELERLQAASAAEKRALEERMAALEEKVKATDGLTYQQQVQQFAQQYHAVRGQLQEAIEEGNTEKQLELTETLADMRAEARMRDAAAKAATEQPKPQPQPKPEQPQAPREAMKWWGKNAWFNSPGFEEETQVARRIDAALHAEGTWQNDEPEYYEEMDKRLQKRFPELYSGGSDEQPSRPKGSSPSRGKSGGGSKGRVGSNGKLTFTKAELAMAKSLGLTTKEQLTQYARELERGEN